MTLAGYLKKYGVPQEEGVPIIMMVGSDDKATAEMTDYLKANPNKTGREYLEEAFRIGKKHRLTYGGETQSER